MYVFSLKHYKNFFKLEDRFWFSRKKVQQLCFLGASLHYVMALSLYTQ